MLKKNNAEPDPSKIEKVAEDKEIYSDEEDNY